ncbi:MAG: transglutaminase-like domain-containing protein [Ignavibacteriales bacterium]|nr:transglutaminase-like domain-containing protein [Ignavibacteriales bacterium]
MTSENKLYYLIELVDDLSEEVRAEIVQQLNNYGFTLERDLKELPANVVADKMIHLAPILTSNRMNWLEKNWQNWFNKTTHHEKIECALDLISRFHYGIYFTPALSELLDQLSNEFKNKIPYGDELDLTNFLFHEKELSGSKDDYYNPFNCNPIYTIKEKKGLPITLSLIYILIGDRLGFDIHGCNFPGHFLAKIYSDDEIILIDCFNKGKIIFESDINEALDYPVDSIIDVIHNDVSAEVIITRVANNLINAYKFINDYNCTNLFKNLSKQIPSKSSI